jgi:hypothetical protein
MNTQQRFLVTSFAFLAAGLGAGQAFAQEATPDTWQAVTSQASRAEVQAEATAALHAGLIAYGEASLAPEAAPATKSRAQVHAEALAARRLGLVGQGEVTAPAPSAEQLRAIEQAGQAALNAQYANAG